MTLFISVPSWCMVLICRVVQEALLFAPDYNSLLLFRPGTDSLLAAVGGCVVFPPCAASVSCPWSSEANQCYAVASCRSSCTKANLQPFIACVQVRCVQVSLCTIIDWWSCKKIFGSLIVKRSQTCSRRASVNCQSKSWAWIWSRSFILSSNTQWDAFAHGLKHFMTFPFWYGGGRCDGKKQQYRSMFI